MAVIKAVSSKAGITSVIDYVTKDEKTERKLVSGLNCSPETVKDEMRITKQLWGKPHGRTYKHFVQSFAPDEKIDPVQAHQIACKLAEACPEWKGFEVLIATHQDKHHIHTHFIVNSVSFENGYKLQQSKENLQNMKELSDGLCKEFGLHITEKGMTFHGQKREETSAWHKDTYQLLKKAETGEVKSYVQDIALAVLDCLETAVSRQDFCQKMHTRGYGVEWKDSHKYITFTDIARKENGEKQCKIRNNKLESYYNMEFGKEYMEREFKRNARTAETAAVWDPKRAATGVESSEQDRVGEQPAQGSISLIQRELRGIDEAVKSRTSQGRAEQATRRRAKQEADRRVEAERGANEEQQRATSECHITEDWELER